nr:hypothetical protein [Nanoarchaeum sp.]
MSLIQRLRTNVTGPVLGLGMLASLAGCSGEPKTVDNHSRGEPYPSYGVVSTKEVFPDYNLRRLGLKKTNPKGETFVDDHYVWLADIPEFPNTALAINSPNLYNSVSVGDTVNLELRESMYWIEDQTGNQLSEQRSHIEIQDYSPRTNNAETGEN